MNITAVRRLWFAAMLGLSLVPVGCARNLGDDLVIASSWPASERNALETEFRRWIARTPGVRPGPIRIGWVVLDPGDDPARVVRRRPPIDLLLGGPASVFDRLARSDVLAPVEGGDTRWRVARRSSIGLATNTSPRHRGLAFDDPRHDPVTLSWLRTRLDAEGWAAGYARLVRDVGHSRRIGRQSGSALAAVARGEAESTLAVASEGQEWKPPLRASNRTLPLAKGESEGVFFGTAPASPGPPSIPPWKGGKEELLDALRFVPLEGSAEWVEGVALIAGGRHPGRARDFLRFLAGRDQADAPPSGSSGPTEADGLLADLLGATLVDAQDELWSGWSSLDRTGQPGPSETWMTEAPPWPPASVESLLASSETAPLVQTLAAELAPDADVRAWLVQSWLRPTRPINGSLLHQLAEAAGGRLAREPRFRDWLRAEWTAWARQRYRRVADNPGEASP